MTAGPTTAATAPAMAGTVPTDRPASGARPATTLPGRPFPLGATPGRHLGRAGTNFALATSVASGVTLCLFDQAGIETRIPLTDNDADTRPPLVLSPGISWQIQDASATSVLRPGMLRMCRALSSQTCMTSSSM